MEITSSVESGSLTVDANGKTILAKDAPASQEVSNWNPSGPTQIDVTFLPAGGRIRARLKIVLNGQTICDLSPNKTTDQADGYTYDV